MLKLLTVFNILSKAYSRYDRAKKKEKGKEYQNRIEQIKGSAFFFSSELNKKFKISGCD